VKNGTKNSQKRPTKSIKFKRLRCIFYFRIKFYSKMQLNYLSSRFIDHSCTVLISTFGPTKLRIFLNRYFIIVSLSSDKPKTSTLTLAGMFIGSSILRLHIPELPMSIHLPRPGWKQKIFIDGSVYGLEFEFLQTKIFCIILRRSS
jgi:hypothetical protein